MCTDQSSLSVPPQTSEREPDLAGRRLGHRVGDRVVDHSHRGATIGSRRIQATGMDEKNMLASPAEIMIQTVGAASTAQEALVGDSAANCLNCGSTLSGKYCSECGQRSQGTRLHVKHLVSEFLDECFDLDGKLLRTLLRLLFKPGYLTREYWAGRRTRYVPPFRLYFFSAVIYFFLLPFFPTRPISTLQRGTNPTTTISSIDTPDGVLRPESPLHSKLRAFLHGDRQAQVRKVVDVFAREGSKAMLVLLPILAWVAMILYSRSGRLYVDHFIFALHYQAARFAILIVLLPFHGSGSVWRGEVVPLVYSFFALKNAYGESIVRTGFKALIFSFASLVAQIVVIGLFVLFMILWRQPG